MDEAQKVRHLHWQDFAGDLHTGVEQNKTTCKVNECYQYSKRSVKHKQPIRRRMRDAGMRSVYSQHADIDI